MFDLLLYLLKEVYLQLGYQNYNWRVKTEDGPKVKI